jgi:tetratricopeptide (TPR) repeat protein
VNQVRPLVSEHPSWPVLQAYTVDRGQDGGATLARLAQLPTHELEAKEDFFITAVRGFGYPDNDPRFANIRSANKHADYVARDMAAVIRHTTRESLATSAMNLVIISPYSPIGVATLIDVNWASAIKHQPEPEKYHAEHPEVLVALGKHTADEKRLEDAERLIAAAIKKSPDQASYAALAAIYESLGQMDRWKATLDAFLAEEDPGLDHARVRVEIARYYMGRKEFDLALPYAEGAANTWAGWAMECAAECAEQMQDWDRDELWYQRLSERYPRSAMAWYFFWARTGHGDRDAASELMEQTIADLGDSADFERLGLIGTYYLLSKKPEKALEIFRKVRELDRSRPSSKGEGMFAGMHLAVIADGLGDAKRCDQNLEEIAKEYAQRAPRMVEICRLLRDWLARPQPTPADFDPVDAVYSAMPEQARASFGYFLGRFLDQHGQTQKAMKYHGDSIRVPNGPYLLRYLSSNVLRTRGIKIGPDGQF